MNMIEVSRSAFYDMLDVEKPVTNIYTLFVDPTQTVHLYKLIASQEVIAKIVQMHSDKGTINRYYVAGELA